MVGVLPTKGESIMPKMKRKPTAALKVKVAIAAITEKLTTSQIVSRP